MLIVNMYERTTIRQYLILAIVTIGSSKCIKAIGTFLHPTTVDMVVESRAHTYIEGVSHHSTSQDSLQVRLLPGYKHSLLERYLPP